MPHFSETSLNRLLTCDDRLQKVFLEVIKFFDCSILEGHRGKMAQEAAFAAGASKVKWPHSRHNKSPSMAIDVAPYPIKWKDRYRFYYFAGHVMRTAKFMDIDLRWGGDWDRDSEVSDQTFFDLVHFELID